MSPGPLQITKLIDRHATRKRCNFCWWITTRGSGNSACKSLQRAVLMWNVRGDEALRLCQTWPVRSSRNRLSHRNCGVGEDYCVLSKETNGPKSSSFAGNSCIGVLGFPVPHSLRTPGTRTGEPKTVYAAFATLSSIATALFTSLTPKNTTGEPVWSTPV